MYSAIRCPAVAVEAICDHVFGNRVVNGNFLVLTDILFRNEPSVPEFGIWFAGVVEATENAYRFDLSPVEGQGVFGTMVVVDR